ncbi:hypothetical protein [Catenuloplanes japonicus]|uniref:hypothetical protein n=1 Tax=Catenuloplanes japonicus TaxID=33876 RepID=UPI0005245432|nr:hypothetical protein [Catenuloplanes japonicus]
MSQFHNVFCASPAALSRTDLAGRIEDAWYGDGEPAFAPVPDTDPAWQRLEVRLPGIGRPIVFLHDTGVAEIGELVDEAAGAPPTPLRPETAERLRGTRQIIGIEIMPDGLDDDAWEMLDLVQAFIARELDGLLFTPDGVYDARLQRIS